MNRFTNISIVLLLAASFPTVTYSQDFILLAEDPENDEVLNGTDDLKAIYYALDEANDSLWFKITYYEGDASGDLGLVFGIDTNLVADDGLFWDGDNQSLQPDVVFTINHVFFSVPFYGFSNHDFYYQARAGDDNQEVIVNIKYSELDSDGKFNLLIGAAFFSVDVNSRETYDQLPNNGQGYIVFPPAPSSVGEVGNGQPPLQFSPNPASNFFGINTMEKGQLQIVDVTGKLVYRGNYQPGDQLDCSKWAAGWYSVQLATDSSRFVGNLLKN